MHRSQPLGGARGTPAQGGPPKGARGLHSQLTCQEARWATEAAREAGEQQRGGVGETRAAGGCWTTRRGSQVTPPEQGGPLLCLSLESPPATPDWEPPPDCSAGGRC
ncbi:hypothetical protein KIL84_008447 [Mauremys mutica]|uniref:Uncharacterized protein n=1 Tax=Mauremys mutica TaxID=74926 RepID=A0A9D3X720_9SAUR|nr:hypothetical protein KIL84_008447 [Mauremys mutica]